jgi:hypothetical protein
MKYHSYLSAALILSALGCAEVGEEYRDIVRPEASDMDLSDPAGDIMDVLPDGTDPVPDVPIDLPADTGDLDAADTGDPEPDGTDATDTAPDDVTVEDTAVDPGPGTCTASDFPVQTQCNSGYKCTLGTTTSCAPTGLCDLPGPQGENDICTGSGDSDNCQAGFICLGDGVEERCREFCSTDSDCLGANAGCLITISTGSCSTGLTGVKVCSHNCDYFYQTGCQSGQACRALVPIAAFQVYSDCTAAGTGTQDASCPNGSTDCAPGYDCFDVDDGSGITQPLCLKLCNYSGGFPTCDYGYTCSRGTDWPLPIGACL